MSDPTEKLIDRIKDSLGDAVDEIDDDEIKEAIGEHIDLPEIVGELMTEDSDVQEALKKKVKQLLIDEINNIDDGDDMDNFLKDDATWETETQSIFGIEEILKELIDGDDKIQRDLKKKVKELVVSHIEELSDDDLPDMDELLQKLNFQEMMETMMSDPSFQKELTEVLERSAKKTVISMAKSGDNKIEKAVREHPQIQDIINNQVENLLRDSAFLNDLRKVLMVKVSDTPDLHKALLTTMFSKVVEQLVDNMFRR